MTPIRMFRYKGFLVRVCHNGSQSHPYEWTVDPITPEAKRQMRIVRRYFDQRAKQCRWHRPLRRRMTPDVAKYYVKRRLNMRNKRVYDPTSMPTAYGRCSAQFYGKDEVDVLLGWKSDQATRCG